MCSDKADVDESYCELNYSNDSIGIPFDIKDISLVPNTINTVKGLLHICITCPMAVFHNIHPYLEWKKRIRMCVCKLRKPENKFSLFFGQLIKEWHILKHFPQRVPRTLYA